jgi:prevent-host-death family protein
MTRYGGHVVQRTIPASEFKAKCLALLDEVAETKETLVVTKRGKPVARVMPVQEPRSLLGSVTYLVSDEELIKPVWDDWELDSSLFDE